MTYRPDIDGLRAVAILLVVLFHAFPALMPGGFIGVDIFFVISGYLISGVILCRLEDGTYSFADFYKRRILRIFPALVVVLGLCVAAGCLLLTPNAFMSLGKHVVGGATFVSNILLYNETGYFDAAAHAKPLLNLWSLGIEEQFYLVFPLLMWLFWRLAAARTPSLRRRLCALLAVICLFSFADNIFLYGRHPSADFYLPLSRFWELLAGAVLQAAARPVGASSGIAGRAGKSRARSGLAFAGAALLLVALFACDNGTGTYPGFLALLPVGSAFLLIAAGPENPFNRLVLANPASVFLGKISYTLYLWHWPLLSFAWILLGGSAYAEAHALRAGLLAVALVLAALTWRFLETPVRRGNFLGRYKVPVLVGAMCVVGGAGLVVWLSEGLALFTGAQHRAVYAQLQRPPQYELEVLEKLGLKKDDLELARFTDAGASRTVAVVGDSHAQSAYPGIAGLGREAGFNTLLLGRFPGRKRPYYDTTAHPGRILDILARAKDIRDVFIIIRGAVYTPRTPGEEASVKSPEEFYGEMADFVKKLVALGKNPIVVEDNPDLDVDVSEALAPAISGEPVRREYRRTLKADALARQGTWLGIMDRLGRIPGVTVLRGTLDAFCPGETCRVFSEEGLPLYFDADHLSFAGSDRLARHVIAPWLARNTSRPGD
ncbi:acyltransferase family protein [Desulfovibrio sp.]|uniref:acyltransferase family protein n=1 Tax=Desulfovibrio sp. TaxID=885 RepID=UPI0023C6346A|nr:acyltransferase family protein [Desulfovibrio sp.]MDE7241594.1 acyltransferase [Desulfovibrio sp.]